MTANPLRRQDIYYPESDGKPLAETGIHVEEVFGLLGGLRRHFQEVPDVYVGANMFLYYVQGDPRAVVCPDVFVVKGISKAQRRIYKLWEEGRPPSLVIEVTSTSTWEEDTSKKKSVYESIGVEEYLLHDPLGEYLKPPLQGFRLTKGRYQPVAPAPDGSFSLRSLGFTARTEGNRLRLIDPAGNPLLYDDEFNRWALEADAKRRAAEEEAARLRAELEQLRRKG